MQTHFHEGLFLLPHHIQRLQRNTFDLLKRARDLSWAYPYGAVEAKISSDDLENNRLRFESLRVVMPSGLEVDHPDGAELPSRDIKDALAEKGTLTVYLAVPLWFSTRANCVANDESFDPRAKILYRVIEHEWADENTGENPKPILERRVNARLIFDNEDRSDMETIPLLRVVRSSGENIGAPQQDPEFIGPCLILNGSRSLSEMVRNLSGQIQASRKELIIQINRGGFTLDTLRGLQLEQILRLQFLNTSATRIDALLRVPSVTPFQIYMEMLELVSTLSALHPERDFFENVPAYDHDNPYPCFYELSQRIRLFLRGGVKPNFLKVVFEPRGGILQATLEENHFTEPNDYFLGIRTKQDPILLAQAVQNEDRFKLMPSSMVNRAIRGVVLKEERLPPLALPASSGLYYFRLLRNESVDVWKMIQQEKLLSLLWSGNDSADYQVTLYMTLPSDS